MKRLIVLSFIFSISTLIFSQTEKLSAYIVAIAEELAADESDPGAVEIFTERLYELFEDPVMINSGDEKEITRLFFLTDFQIKALADHVRRAGRIISHFEIANIPGFDRETVEMMIPFITLEESLQNFNDSARLRHSVLTNFIYKSSLEDTTLLGSPWKILTKYKLMSGSFSGGFTAEKDPGEKCFTDNPPLPDFFSAYLTYKGAGLIKRIVLGDYSARFGQGTSMNTGIRTGLSLTAPGYLAGRSEIRPYTSTDENNFLRGTAAEFSVRNLDMSIFFSANKIDATLNDSGNSMDLSIRSFYKTGLHSTPATIIKRDAVTETTYGINMSYNLYNLRVGFMWSENSLSLPVIPVITNPADKYDFKGNKNTLYTLYYNSLFKRFLFFGEFSSGGQDKYALVQGLTLRPSDRLNINFMFRDYSTGYVSFHGNGPGGSSPNSNEYGILGNFIYEAAKYLFINAGSEIKYYPWLRYRCSAPSMAKRYELKIRYYPSDRLTFETLYNYRFSMVDGQDDIGIPKQDEIITQSIRGSVKYSPADNITFVTRIDYKEVGPSGSRGSLLLQDMNIKLKKVPVSLWVRYCIFNTGGFESGLYTWENDLLYSFSVPVMYGSGSRVYLMVSWKIGDKGEIRLKYATTTSVTKTSFDEFQEFRIQFKINI